MFTNIHKGMSKRKTILGFSFKRVSFQYYVRFWNRLLLTTSDVLNFLWPCYVTSSLVLKTGSFGRHWRHWNAIKAEMPIIRSSIFIAAVWKQNFENSFFSSDFNARRLRPQNTGVKMIGSVKYLLNYIASV